VTDFQHLKLGKLPAIRYHALGWAEDYLLGKPPQPAGKVVAPVPAGGWGMADNDTLGDCVEAGTDHAIKAMNALLGTHDYEPTDPEISEQYFHETGGSDTGLVVATHLLTWQRYGLFAPPYAPIGTKVNRIGAFAPVKTDSLVAFQRCIDLFGFAFMGIQCPQSMQDQFGIPGREITVVKGSPIEGGHCILGVGYDDDSCEIITWGQRRKMSYGFLAAYMDECDAVISMEVLEKGHGPGPKIDKAALLADIKSLAL
jgi:hypothetical protein